MSSPKAPNLTTVESSRSTASPDSLESSEKDPNRDSFGTDYQEDDEHVRSRYIIFTLQGELYGSRLLQIREVIKMTTIKPVPHTESWLKGVINLRGRIISVMDLRTKFGIRHPDDQAGLILIAESDQGVAGAIVDTIEFVREIPHSDIDSHPGIDTRIPLNQFIGVAKSGTQLIHLLDIARIVSDLRGDTKQKLAETTKALKESA